MYMYKYILLPGIYIRISQRFFGAYIIGIYIFDLYIIFI